MMQNSAARLQWLINFAQMELGYMADDEGKEYAIPSGLKEWEWLRLKDEIVQFIGGEDAAEPFSFRLHEQMHINEATGRMSDDESSLVESIVERLTTNTIFEIQETMKDYLVYRVAPKIPVNAESIEIRTFPSQADLVRHKRKSKSLKKRNVKLADNPLRIQDTIYFGSPYVAFHLSTRKWIIRARLMGLFFIRVGLLLMEEGVSRIQNCPECGRVFYRVRKQLYCSKTCINRVTRRKWLANPKNKKKERQWSRERYERRMQQKTNSNIRVQSRPKKGGKN
jgi:hypothetical protein